MRHATLRAALERGLWVTLALPSVAAASVRRFPRPDFAGGYVPPVTTEPIARWQYAEWIDVLLLGVALIIAARLALRWRSRRGLQVLAVFSLVWFGFVRRGCICSVGSIQNMALGWGGHGYVVPLTIIVCFALPLLFALFTGRTFCAAICPLGALQEQSLWRPVKLPGWLCHMLGMVPWVVLAVAVLFASTGIGFPICRADPYVGFFRLAAPLHMLAIGLVVLFAGLFVGRPYCRFFCPYGALMGVASRFSRRHVTITPDRCIQCRLCEDACPYGAIRKPMPGAAPEPLERGTRRIATLLFLAPLVIVAAWGTGWLFGTFLSPSHNQVALALELQQDATPDFAAMSAARETFLGSGRTAGDVLETARSIQRRMAVGGGLLGGLLALGACLKVLGLSVWRHRTDYEPDRGLCFSCGRCFASCPVPAPARSR